MTHNVADVKPMKTEGVDISPVAVDSKPMLIHYGPIYDRPLGHSLALCEPPGGFATMSNDWKSVNCEKCRTIGSKK